MTLGVLSWGAHQTLRNTLQSYRENGLDVLDNDRIIFFQESSSEDLKIANEFGWAKIGSTTNIGIAAAYQQLVEAASGEFFLFLENDWELIECPAYRFKAAQHLLSLGVVDVVRFRHRNNPGSPLWTLQFAGQEQERPTHLLDAVHWKEDPTQVGLGQINFLTMDLHGNFREDRFWTAPAKNANWTNNPHMAKTSFLKKNLLPRISGDIEVTLQDWWSQQDFVVAQGEGLFTHRRLDR